MSVTPFRAPRRPAPPLSRRVVSVTLIIGIGAAYWLSLDIVGFDLRKLIDGLPLMAQWAAKAWPPDTHGGPLLLQRAAETFAMALIGTTLGVLFALPMSLVASRNLNSNPWLYQGTRWLMNVLRGTDTLIFAILFVVAVGLGPFAGVLGMSLHTTGIVAKLWSEAIEGIDQGPLDATSLTGATWTKTVSYALLPDIFPTLTSVALYALEFNVRASTVLGLVGAGGIGQELKNSVDLLNFPRIFTIVLIVLVLVTVVDQLSAYIRSRLV